MPNAANRILHLSDLNIVEGDALEQMADRLKAAFQSSEGFAPFDFIVVAGDIVLPTGDADARARAFQRAHEFLERLKQSLLAKPENSRILIVPGDHDWDAEGHFLHFNKFRRGWYGCDVNVHELRMEDNDRSASAFVVDQSAENACFMLMNSYWGTMDGSDILGKGCITPNQRFQFQKYISENSWRRDAAKLVVMHLHVLPPPKGGGRGGEDVEQFCVTDFSTTLEWMTNQKVVAVFHGYARSTGFSLLRTNWQSGKPPIEGQYSKEIVLLGAGTMSARTDLSNPSNGLKQFQRVDINLNPRRFFDSTIVSTIYDFRGESWQASPEIISSHQTHTAFQTQLVESEQFTCDQIREYSNHPLRGDDTSGSWFWDTYNTCWEVKPTDPQPSDQVKQVIGETPLKEPSANYSPKTNFLYRLVTELKQHNRKKSIFELLPFQLDAIYTYCALFFKNEDIESEAIKEFSTDAWLTMLESNDTTAHPRWTHLDWANWTIANEVSEWKLREKPDCVGIVDLGYGLLRTIDAIGKMLPERNDKTGQNCTHIEQKYLGIDISEDIKSRVKDMIGAGNNNSSFFSDRRTKMFRGFEDHFTAEAGRFFWRSKNPRLEELRTDGFNVFVCAYAMHHCSNNFRVRKCLIDGSFFDFIKVHVSGINKYLADNFTRLFRTDTDAGIRDEICTSLAWLYQQRNKGGNRQKNPYTAHAEDVARYVERVLDLAFPNSQLELLRNVYRTLQAGGLVCIADPNGMSRTFNRQEIFRKASIAVAHFSDWPDMARMLHTAGFRRIRIFRQVRLNGLQVRRTAVAESAIKFVLNREDAYKVPRDQAFSETIMAESFDKFSINVAGSVVSPLEILDQHLGYIAIAEKPAGGSGVE